MNKRKTKKQQIRNKVYRLLQNETFITWDKLGFLPLNNYSYQTHDAGVVFDYMKEFGIDYMRYRDKYSDKKVHGNTGGFYNDIPGRRKRKLQQIIKNNKN